MSNIRKPHVAKFLPFLLILFLSFSLATAHDEVEEHTVEDAHSEEEHANAETATSLEEHVKSTSMQLTLMALSAIAIIVIITKIYKKKVEKNNNVKILLFSLIVIVTLATTLYIAGSTIRLNISSETGGPVHWHADFEIWNCNEKLDLEDPSGLANRVGTSTFHEHGDDRIHLEGVVVNSEEVNLHNFFHVIGATLTQDSLSLQTNDGLIEVTNGDTCNGTPGKLQVFSYSITNPDESDNWTYVQTKLSNFENYVLSPHSSIPPGDCLIIEFDNEKSSTDKICETYKIAIDRGKLRGD